MVGTSQPGLIMSVRCKGLKCALLSNNIMRPREAVITAENLSLAEILDEHMYVGFSGSTGEVSEIRRVQSWSFVNYDLSEFADNPSAATDPASVFNPASIGIISGVCAGVLGALILALLYGRTLFIRRYGKSTLSFMDQSFVPRMFTYKELSKATKNFNKSELLGSGGFGAVYKGTLPSGAMMAVKRMKHESKHGEEGLKAEAASLSQIRHRNLVQLRGWCYEEEQLLLVCDYMCNGSLDEWLFPSSKREFEVLPWRLRHSTLSGVAAALAYLHDECVQCVLHRDIKSNNVLLDCDFNAYLGDFGLARLIDHQKMEKTTMMAGTLGYMAPELPFTGKANKESDTYSFGILVLEVVCGARPLDVHAIERGDGILVDRVWRAHESGNILRVADLRLGAFFTFEADSSAGAETESQGEGRISPTNVHCDFDHSANLDQDAAMEQKQMITNFLRLGLLCCHPNPEDRLSMRLVSQLMQSTEYMEMPHLPASKPHVQYESSPEFSEMQIPSSSAFPSVLVNHDGAAIELAHTSTSVSTRTSGNSSADALIPFAATS